MRAFVRDLQARVLGRSQREVSEVRRRRNDVPRPVLLQPALGGKIVGFAEAYERRQVSGDGNETVMFHGLRDVHQDGRSQGAPHCDFIGGFAPDFRFRRGRQLQGRDLAVPLVLERLEGHGPRPLMVADLQHLLRAVRQQRDVLQEPDVLFPADGGSIPQSRQLFLQPGAV